jgi:uncharacterized protein YndB with AHSA1/START domain
MTPIEKSVVLACSIERAFALFTEEIGQWWPPDRRHTGDPESTMQLLASGRFFERARDGREIELGRVRAWEPPSRLVLDFYPGTSADHPTEVEVLFAAVAAPAATRVTVLHRATPASAGLFERTAPRFAASWDRVLMALARRASGLADS